MCAKCDDLRVRFEFRTLDEDLQKTLRVVRANLADGTLTEVPPRNPSFSPFAAFFEPFPWPDVLVSQFRCSSCACLFELGVDVYHGRGNWQELSESSFQH